MLQAEIAAFLDLWKLHRQKEGKWKFKSFFMDEETVASIIFPAYLSTYWDTICFLGLREVI